MSYFDAVASVPLDPPLDVVVAVVKVRPPKRAREIRARPLGRPTRHELATIICACCCKEFTFKRYDTDHQGNGRRRKFCSRACRLGGSVRALGGVSQDQIIKLVGAVVSEIVQPELREEVTQELVVKLIAGDISPSDLRDAASVCRRRLLREYGNGYKFRSLDTPTRDGDERTLHDLLADGTP